MQDKKTSSHQALLLALNGHNAVGAPYFQSMAGHNIHDDVKDFYKGLPDYESLFGSHDTSACDHDRSLYSPAAYFVDLMRLIETHIKQKGGLSLKDRRPDLWQIPLDAEHTNHEIPYLEIVNKVLTNGIKKLLGDNVDSPDKVMEYLATAIHTFNLPYNALLEEIRIYLKHFNTDLASIYDISQADINSLAREQLGLSFEEYSFIVNNDTRKETFIRLANKLQWSFADLDWAMKSIDQEDVDQQAIRRFAKIKNFTDRYKLPIDEACCFWYDMKTDSKGDGPKPQDLFSRTFGRDGQDEFFSTAVFEALNQDDPENQKNRAWLRSTLNLDDEDLIKIIAFGVRNYILENVKGYNNDEDLKDVKVSLTIPNLTCLYRLRQLAILLELPISETLLLLDILDTKLNSIEDLIAITDYTEWLKKADLTVYELHYMLTGKKSHSLDAGFTYSTKALAALYEGSSVPNINQTAKSKALSVVYGLEDILEVKPKTIKHFLESREGSEPFIFHGFIKSNNEIKRIIENLTRDLYVSRFLDLTDSDIKRIDVKNLTAEDIRTYHTINKLGKNFKYPENKLLSGLLELKSGRKEGKFTEEGEKSLSKLQALITEIADWDKDQLDRLFQDELFKQFMASPKTTIDQILIGINSCFGIAKLMGVDISFLLRIRNLAKLKEDKAEHSGRGRRRLRRTKQREDKARQAYQSIATELKAAIKAKHDEESWANVHPPMQDLLNEKKRDALAGLMIHLLNEDSKNIKAFGSINTLEDLSSYLLIDVEMSSCMEISRIKQGLNTLQLYINRCRSQLEPGTTNSIPEKHWAWTSHYRVWEANRKVFLHPENYLDPALRKDKTPEFRDLQDELLQGEITVESVERAYNTYFDKVENLSRLKIVSTYHTKINIPGEGRSENTLFLFARSHTSPVVYYYRTAIIAETEEWYNDPPEISQWRPWQKVDLTINADAISAIHAYGKLFVFWVEQKEVRERSQEKVEVVHTKATVKYSFQNISGKWSHPQTLASLKDKIIAKNGSEINAEIENLNDELDKLFNKAASKSKRVKLTSVGNLSSHYNYDIPTSWINGMEYYSSRHEFAKIARKAEPTRTKLLKKNLVDYGWACIKRDVYNDPVNAGVEGKAVLAGRPFDLWTDGNARATSTLEKELKRLKAVAKEMFDKLKNLDDLKKTQLGFENWHNAHLKDKAYTSVKLTKVPMNDGSLEILISYGEEDEVIRRKHRLPFFTVTLDNGLQDNYFHFDEKNKKSGEFKQHLEVHNDEKGVVHLSYEYKLSGFDNLKLIKAINALKNSDLKDIIKGITITLHEYELEISKDELEKAIRVMLEAKDGRSLEDKLGLMLGRRHKKTKESDDRKHYKHIVHDFIDSGSSAINALSRRMFEGGVANLLTLEAQINPVFRSIEIEPHELISKIDDLGQKQQGKAMNYFKTVANYMKEKLLIRHNLDFFSWLDDVSRKLEEYNPTFFSTIDEVSKKLGKGDPFFLNMTEDEDNEEYHYHGEISEDFYYGKADYMDHTMGELEQLEEEGFFHYQDEGNFMMDYITEKLGRNDSPEISSTIDKNYKIKIGYTTRNGEPQEDYSDFVEDKCKEAFQNLCRRIITIIYLKWVMHKSVEKNHYPDFSGAFGIYFWEIFFHTPSLIASGLNNNEKFEEAQKWYQTIFNPTIAKDTSGKHKNDRFWRFRPFCDRKKDSLMAIIADKQALAVYENDPFDPHALARLRIGAYEKTIVMRYIDNLLDWGDHLFSQDSWEAIAQATMLYTEAQDLLGKRPIEIKSDEISKVENYEELKKNNFGRLEIEETANEKKLILNKTIKPVGYHPLDVNDLNYFCLLENDEFVKYWDRVADRLFKIRHCLNIKGVKRQLALFQSPIDPRQLVRSLALGGSLDETLKALHTPFPHYRFSVMIQQARTITSSLIQLGAGLLAALEKKDGVKLARLRASHEKAILNLTTQVKEKQIEEALENIEMLKHSRDNAKRRSEHYGGLKKDGLNTWESVNIGLMAASLYYHLGAIGVRAGAVMGHSTPTIYGTSSGGAQPGSSISEAASIADSIAGTLSHGAAMAATMGQFERRKEDWALQEKLALHDIYQTNSQIEAAKIHKAVAERSLEIHQKSIEHADEMETFIKDRFGNEERYGWMVKRLGAIYRDTYYLALQQAKAVEACYRYERNVTNTTFIKPSYSDTLHKRLLAGEELMAALNHMEVAYREKHSRELEIEKTISLRQIKPEALLDLKNKGKCNFDLTEALFDRDFPGHYCRKIASIAITIPAIVGPYQNVQATLIQQYSRVVLTPNFNTVKFLVDHKDLSIKTDANTSELRIDPRPKQQIALSKGIKDSGLFELNFHDERYLPFEGTGAVSSWTLKMPKAANRINFDSISDVIIHLRYTALDGGESLREKVVKELPSIAKDMGYRLISLRQEFPAAWQGFVEAKNIEEVRLPFTIRAEMFPVNLDAKKIKLPDPCVLYALKKNTDGSGTVISESNLDGITLKKLNSKNLEKVLGEWVVTAEDVNELDKLTDLLVIMPYEGELDWGS